MTIPEGDAMTTGLLKKLAWFLIVLTPASGGRLFAQSAAGISDDQVKERLAFIEKALNEGRPRARTWWYGWLAGYGAATVAQWGLSIAHWNDVKPADDSPGAAKVHDREFAQDMLVGGATTALGVGGLLIDAFRPAGGAGALGSLPEGTPEERRAKLERAEERLRRCAERERSGRGWTTHLLNLGANAAAGVVTAAAFKRPWTDGLTTFAIGEAVSLFNIFSQPRRAVRDWRDYQTRYPGGTGAAVPEPADSRWTLGVSPGGLSLSYEW
jgi:hypothetical protein